MSKIKTVKLGFDKMRSNFFLGLVIILSIGMLFIFRPFLYPIFWAAIIAIIFYPIYKWFNRYLKIQNISAFLTLILVVIVIFLPLTLLSSLLINQSLTLYNSVSNWNITEQVQGANSLINKTLFS